MRGHDTETVGHDTESTGHDTPKYPLTVIQITLALQKHKSVVHEASALLSRQLFTQALSDSL
jgi:hypothetical protein